VAKSELTTVLSGYNFSQRLRRICLSDKAFRSLASGTFTKTAELESMDIDVSTGEFLQWQGLRSNTTTFIFLKLFYFKHLKPWASEGAGEALVSLDFETCQFPVKFLAEILFSQFRVGKMKFNHFFHAGKIFLSTPGKIHCFSPGKYPFDAHA